MYSRNIFSTHYFLLSFFRFMILWIISCPFWSWDHNWYFLQCNEQTNTKNTFSVKVGFTERVKNFKNCLNFRSRPRVMTTAGENIPNLLTASGLWRDRREPTLFYRYYMYNCILYNFSLNVFRSLNSTLQICIAVSFCFKKYGRAAVDTLQNCRTSMEVKKLQQ